jgi:hypothetical protein
MQMLEKVKVKKKTHPKWRSLTGWILNSSESQQSKDAAKDDGSEEFAIIHHRKQLAQILRYIATMHHSLGASSSAADANNGTAAAAKRGCYNGHSFVRRSRNTQACWKSSFCQEMESAGADERFGVLLSTHNFRHLLSIQADSSTALFESPPFSFYAATAGQSPSEAVRKQAWANAFKNPLSPSNSSSTNGMDGKSCWLRKNS